MQPTARVAAWSTWAGWAAVPRDLLERRRVRISLHELPPRADRRDGPIALYTPEQIRHFIRLETAIGRWPPTMPPALWRPETRPYDIDAHWRLPEMIQNVRLERGGGGGGGGLPMGAGQAVGAPRGWDGAARGWAAGAVLLAVLLLLVRALERCLHRRLFKGRRRSSEEWPRPNVMATNCQYGGALSPRLDDSDTYQSDNRESSGNDLPPPYSECANGEEATTPDPNKPIGMEEPPPPYSACYFCNPKDGIPTVHFYNRRNEIGQSSTDDDLPTISIIATEDADKISNCDVSEDNRDLGNINQRCEERGDVITDSNDVEVRSNIDEVGTRHRGNDHIVQVEESATHEVVVRV